jgi:hypothetical protein
MKGKTSVLLISTNQLVKKEIFKKYFRGLITYEKLGEIAFIKNGVQGSEYTRDFCLVYFIQPIHLQIRFDKTK